jgi:hypothetical protein
MLHAGLLFERRCNEEEIGLLACHIGGAQHEGLFPSLEDSRDFSKEKGLFSEASF